MDLNYNIHSWDFSLRSLTLTKITQDVVEAALKNLHTSGDEIIDLRACEIVENLDLLPGMITEIKEIIPPILWVMQEWYQTNGYSVSPILTPHRTLDVAKSSRAFMRINDEDLPASSNFNMACEYCLEEEIFKFGKRLSEADKLSYEKEYHHLWTMQGFWYSIYKGNFSRMLTLNDLNHANLADGMNRAMREGMSLCNTMSKYMCLAIKYFLKKATQETVQYIENNENRVSFSDRCLSPDTCVMLFKIYQLNSLEGMFSAVLLKTLLQWPYQHLFMEAANTLVLKLTLEGFWEVAFDIIFKALSWNDYNYEGLFVGLWKMRKDYAGADPNGHCGSLLLWYVFQMEDKHIAFMVLNDISERIKEEYLLAFNGHFEILIDVRGFTTLQFIMDVCKAKYELLYLRLKSENQRLEYYRGIFSSEELQAFERLMSE